MSKKCITLTPHVAETLTRSGVTDRSMVSAHPAVIFEQKDIARKSLCSHT